MRRCEMTSADAEAEVKAAKHEISCQVQRLDDNYTEEGQVLLNKLLQKHAHWHAVWRDLLAQGK